MPYAVLAAIDNYDTKGDNILEKEVASFRRLFEDDATVSILSTEDRICVMYVIRRHSFFKMRAIFA